MFGFANPQRFMSFSGAALPWVAAVTVILLGVAAVWGLVLSPADYQQGDTVRIMYVHVPAAWMAMACYAAMAGASFVSLIWGHALADVAAKATAPLGATFTGLALVTGSLWGKPTWGAWWVWDARLTSVLVLFFLYLGYMALWSAIDDRIRAGRLAAILALVGAINLPVIKFSVDFWNTLHQGTSVLRVDGPSLDTVFLYPLLMMALGYMALYVTLLLMRMRTEIWQQQTRAAARRQAVESERPSPQTAESTNG